MTADKNDNRPFPINPWILIIAGGALLLLVAALVLIPRNDEPTPAVGQPATLVVDKNLPYPAVPRISIQDTKASFDDGAAVIVDVRYVEQYEAGHIPGAVVIPPGEFEDRYSELPLETEILLYCT
ncbi:MAG: rhodanese-like domain-containing protein [Chloroflexi bacterium]|nr:rhodanese-like domain-containing protein [Chloroflexota bacterium]